MPEFVKAYCSKSRQYFLFKVESVGGRMAATDFTPTTEDKGKLVGSTVDVPGLEVAPNLRPCYKCGNRKAAHCSCYRRSHECAAGQGYRYQCAMCDQLRIFTRDEGSETTEPIAPGTKVMVDQNYEIFISAAGTAALEEIRVGVGWDVSLGGPNMDVDSSVLLKSSQTGETELVYFANEDDEACSIHHEGDNLYGGVEDGHEDSENINVYLRKVPDKYDQLYFILNIYDCDERDQDFSKVRNLYIRLTNAKNGQVLAEYNTRQTHFGRDTGLIIAKVHRRGDRWYFAKISKSMRVSDVDELAEKCVQ